MIYSVVCRIYDTGFFVFAVSVPAIGNLFVVWLNRIAELSIKHTEILKKLLFHQHYVSIRGVKNILKLIK